MSKPKTIKIEKQEGRNRRIYDVYTAQEFDRLLQSNLRLIRQAAFNEGWVRLDGTGIGKIIGITRESLVNVTRTSADVELYSPMEEGIDYLIFNAITGVIYAITVTDNYDTGLQTILFEETTINAPIDSVIIEQGSQAQKENQLFRERIVRLNENLDQLEFDLEELNDEALPELENKLETLRSYFENPANIPSNYTFFEGIVTNEIWAKTGVFMQGWFNDVFTNNLMANRIISNHIGAGQVTALNIDVDDLAANAAFIVRLMTQELILASASGGSPFIGGLIRTSNFDGNISASNIITSIGTSGWAIDYSGQAVFNNATVRGTIVVTGGNAATQDDIDDVEGLLRVVIRSTSPPANNQRPDGSPLRIGDIWINTSQGDKPHSWNGSGWIQTYTIIDGGNLETGTVTANKLSINGILTLDTNGIIRANYNGTITGGLLDLNNVGTTGWAIDASGQAVFHNLVIRAGDWGGGSGFNIDPNGIRLRTLPLVITQDDELQEIIWLNTSNQISGKLAGGRGFDNTRGMYIYGHHYVNIGTNNSANDLDTPEGIRLRDNVYVIGNRNLYYKGQELDARIESIATSVSVSAGNGLTMSGSTISLGTPSTTTVTSGNGVTSTSHTHALDLSGRTISTNNGLTGGGNLGSNRTFGLTGLALAIHNLSSNGIIIRTGDSTATVRALVGGTGIEISNATGVGGSPTISVSSIVARTNSPTSWGSNAVTAQNFILS